MKVHIIFTFQNGPYGGGNQFLKALRNEFRKSGVYSDDPENADIFLFNSFQNISDVLKIKRRFPDKLFVHRVDGPISLYRNSKSPFVDKLIYKLNEKIADGTVFQSKFSQNENEKLGISTQRFQTIIHNAPDKNIFFPAEEKDFDFNNRKVRIISTAWSSNPMKGFDTYSSLDSLLDFSKYDYTLVGNSPVSFRNINSIPSKTSAELAQLLRNSDIFLTASRKDPCSNSLIEAIACGLPAIVLNDGGHPELIGKGGEIFNKSDEVPALIEKMKDNYKNYSESLPKYDISEISGSYADFLNEIHDRTKQGNYHPKKITWLEKEIIASGNFLQRFF